MSPFLRIGHRGSPVHEVENTIASFERALDEGANGLELDLCLTRDEEVVLWHDASPDGFEARAREWGFEPQVGFRPLPPRDGRFRKRVGELFLDDVLARFGYGPKRGPRDRIASAPVITLDAFLTFLQGRAPLEALFLDLKLGAGEAARAPRLVRRVEALLALRRPAVKRIVYETEHPKVLSAIRRAAPGRARALDVGPLYGFHPFPRLQSAILRAIVHRNAFATAKRPRTCVFRPWRTYRAIARHDVRMRDRYNADASARHGHRIEGLLGFTVNDPDEMRTLVELGFDGLFTDRLDRLDEVLERAAPLALRGSSSRP